MAPTAPIPEDSSQSFASNPSPSSHGKSLTRMAADVECSDGDAEVWRHDKITLDKQESMNWTLDRRMAIQSEIDCLAR